MRTSTLSMCKATWSQTAAMRQAMIPLWQGVPSSPCSIFYTIKNKDRLSLPTLMQITKYFTPNLQDKFLWLAQSFAKRVDNIEGGLSYLASLKGCTTCNRSEKAWVRLELYQFTKTMARLIMFLMSAKISSWFWGSTKIWRATSRG